MADLAWVSAAIHATAADWAARVVTNGGAAVSDNTKNAVSTFCAALDVASISVKMMMVNVFAPDNLTAAITPLYKVYGTDPWTNNNFVASDLTVAGLKGNATNKYLNTGVSANTIYSGVATQAGISLYNTFPDLAITYDFGGIDGANNEFTLSVIQSSSLVTFRNWATGTGQITGTPLTLGLGFYSGNRLSATSANLYAASSANAFASIGSIATTSGAPPANTTNLFVFARSTTNTPGNYTTRRLSFLAVHSGLTSAESQSLFNAVQAMRIKMGGGYV